MMKKDDVIVNNLRTGMIGFESIVLLPGANTVAKEIWLKMKNHPVIIAQMGDGILKVETEISEENGLKDLSPMDAINLIKSTIDVSLLESWQKLDKRKPVLSVITEQLKALSEPAVLIHDKKEE